MKSSVTGIRLVGVRKFILLGFALIAGMALYAEVACSFEGATMNVVAPSTHAGCRLVLLWDAADKGDDPSAWANSREVSAAVPAAGARYAVDLNSLGITNGTPCRIVAYERYRLLDKLQMTSKQCYVDTGFKDTEVYEVRFGFYGNSGNSSSGWNYIMGTAEGTSDSNRGFTVGQNSTSFGSWFWTYTGHRSGSDRPSVSNNTINEAVFGHRKFTLNGNDVKSDLAEGAVGVQNLNIFLGRAQSNTDRYHYGWWSHVSFYGTNGVALLDYIPVQRSDGKVGFWDRVTSSLVTSTGGGAFTAGTVTNEGFEVVCSMQRVRPNHAISLEMRGSKLFVFAPAGLAGEQLMLVWGDGDQGGNIADWPNSVEIASVVGKDGGVYVADLARLGVRNGQTCRVAAVHRFVLLDMLKMPDRTTFVDTGIPDSACYSVRLGFYGNESTGNNSQFCNFIGTGESVGTTGCFTIGMNNDSYTSWYWIHRKNKSDSRPTVSTNSINHVGVTNRMFTVNGIVKDSNLEEGAVGMSGRNMHLGTFVDRSRFLHGWWSYVRFDDADGNAILDYLPAQRTTDGTVGFYDRATGSFVISTGGGAFTAGTATNEAQVVVNSSCAVIPYNIPSLEVTLAGLTLSVGVPTGLAGERLVLLWDDADKGDELSAWAHSEVLAAVLPASGGTYSANLSALGIGRGDVCRVATVNGVQLLDMLQMPNKYSYIDTGIPDSACAGVHYGFYGTGITASFANMIGTVEDGVGFAVGANSSDMSSWYWCYRGTKYNPRPTVSQNSINDASFSSQTFTLNGSVVKAGLPAGAVGTSGANMYLGTWAAKNRFHLGWWSYVRLDDAGGNALIDFVPAQRTTDNKVGFLDRATGAFVASTGSGTFVAGDVTNESFEVEHLWRTVSLADVVATASWTGLGTAGALDDPANWACTNLYGEEVSGLPNEFTDVTIPSAADFTCPEGSAFSCQTLSVGGALTRDRNWRGLDFAKVSGTIDLAGHALQTVARTDMAYAMTVTDTIGGGVLSLAVPDTAVVSNSAVAFTGAMKLVKEGGGEFVAAKVGQTYSGGTDVAAGTFVCGGNGTAGVYGAAGGTNTVYAGSTFDCNGFGEHWQNPFVLAGGTLRTPVRVADVTLTADSFIESPVSNIALANQNSTEATLEMNGHTLTFDIGAGQACALVNLTVTGGGTFLGRSGGYLRLGYEGAQGVRASGTVLDIRHSIWADADSVFLDYFSRYDNGGYDFGPTHPIKVVRRFCPCGDSMRWHSVELQDGAVLDLSQVTGIWNATSQGAHFDGISTLTFAPGATITVDMGDRAPELDDQLTSWSAKPQNVTFTWDLPLPLCALGRGLFAKRDPGLTLIFR